MEELKIIKLTDQKELKECAAEWFHSKWGVPLEAYRESIEESFQEGAVVPAWYVCMDGDKIVAGMGMIENDFHKRKDLTPNLCAVFTETEYRGRGIAGKLLNYVCDDMKSLGIDTIYLITDHTSFYERYGWEFFCMVEEEDGEGLGRMYIHRS